MDSKIHFFYLKRCPSLKERSRLKFFISHIFRNEGKKIKNLSYIFCSDKYLLEINRAYLKHDYYTDIITFDLSGDSDSVEGEIYISIDRVIENAQKIGVSIKAELHRVIFHGVLHLCGYSDKRKLERMEIRNKEDKYLKLYFR